MASRLNIRGTMRSLFQIGKRGFQWKWGDSATLGSNALEARDTTDSAFAKVRGADPVDDEDFVTKGWLNLTGSPAKCTEASASNLVTKLDTAYTLIPSMTLTPGAGTYLVQFNCSISVDRNSRFGRVAVFANGVLVTASERRGGGQANNIQGVATQAKVTVGAGQTIEIHWRLESTGGSPVLSTEGRTLTLLECV